MTEIRLHTLTPVHVGSGVELQKNIEFITREDKIAVVSPEKVLQLIGRDNIHQWTTLIDRGDDLDELLNRLRPGYDIQDVASRLLRKAIAHGHNFRTLKEQMFNGTGKAIIPGSSLKGSIRTALFTEMVNQNVQRINSHDLKNQRGKWNDAYLVKKLFGKDPNKDLLRFLQIGDAHFHDGTTAVSTIILNLYREGWDIKRDTHQLTEVIPAGAGSRFKLRLKGDLLQKNIAQRYIRNKPAFLDSVVSILKTIGKHTEYLISKEIQFWEEEDAYPNEWLDPYIETLQSIRDKIHNGPENETVLRLGGNSGWDFITGGWAKFNEQILSDEEWEGLYKRLNKRRDVDCFPKTRKMDDYGNPMGFVRLTIIH